MSLCQLVFFLPKGCRLAFQRGCLSLFSPPFFKFLLHFPQNDISMFPSSLWHKQIGLIYTHSLCFYWNLTELNTTPKAHSVECKAPQFRFTQFFLFTPIQVFNFPLLTKWLEKPCSEQSETLKLKKNTLITSHIINPAHHTDQNHHVL